MRFNKALMSSAVVLAAFTGAQAQAAGPTLSEVLGNSGVTISGHMSGSYVYNFNNEGGEAGEGDDETVPLRVFDSENDSFQLNQAVLNIGSQPASGFGGFASLMYGEDAQLINAAYGDSSDNTDDDFGDPANDSDKFALVQGFLQYGNGPLTVIGGRYVTLAGAEVIADTGNQNLSRGLLFAFAQPLVHTGVRASWKFNDMVTAYLGAANSGASGAADDNNEQKTVEVALATAPTKNTALAVTYYDGIESSSDGPAGDSQSISYLDVVGSVQILDPLQFVLNYSLADFEDDGEVSGFAAYLNYKVNEKWRVSLRGELVEFDEDGGDKTDLSSYTLTVGHACADNFDLLVEARMDNDEDDIGIFSDDGEFEDDQTTLAVKGIFKF